MVNLSPFFAPKSIAVIGVSRNPNKVGHVIFKNLIEGGFEGEIIPINPETNQILNYKVFASITHVKKKVDLAIIAVPAELVMKVTHECHQAGVKHVLILTAGFKEAGKADLEEALAKYLRATKMRCIGVNCLGIYDAYNKIDALFIPRYRLRRPQPGGISFVCQSGAIGAAITDIATEQHHKFSKFVSYGNATDVDESDLLEEISEDKNTKVICLYLEGVKDGEKFYKTLMNVARKKPIVALKGGLSAAGSQAALSHTGSLAGAREVYEGIFKQTGVIQVETLEEMFDVASIIEKGLVFKGGKTLVMTNGGGYGILSTDYISQTKHLSMAQLSKKTVQELRKAFPPHVNVHNPLDLVGDATTDRYRVALEICVQDEGIDAILLIALYQTPLITTDIVEVISEMHRQTKKPIVVVSTGGEFTENLSDALEESGLPTFSFPERALAAMNKLVWYETKKKR